MSVLETPPRVEPRVETRAEPRVGIRVRARAVRGWRVHRPAPGPVGALLAAAVVLLPSLLPRDPVVQAVLVLVAGLHGHAAGVLVGRLAGRWSRGRLAVPLLPGALTLLVASAAVSFHRQVADARVVHAPMPDLLQHSASVAAGLLLAAVVVHVLRRVRRRAAALATLVAVALGSGAAVHLAAVPSGLKGAQFLAATPTAARIEAVTGRPALQPVRVYAGLDAAPTARGRAQHAVADLVREGGFDRSLLLVAVPTGTGWVNPAAPAAVEFLRDGDTAVVAQQYGASSSFVAYVGGTVAVQESTRALVDAVAGEVRRRRAEGRRVPTVVVTGESLGALGGLRALAGRADRPRGLWVGVPAPARHLLGPGDHVLLHPDDPVGAWSPDLLWRPTSTRDLPWVPVLSFWQATGDLVGAARVPAGHGHRYDAEYLAAFAALTGVVTAYPRAVEQCQLLALAVLAGHP